jgi:hypothetical protein
MKQEGSVRVHDKRRPDQLMTWAQCRAVEDLNLSAAPVGPLHDDRPLFENRGSRVRRAKLFRSEARLV